MPGGPTCWSHARQGRDGHRTRREGFFSGDGDAGRGHRRGGVGHLARAAAQAWTANIIGGFEKALTDAGLLKTLHRPPAICFLDITGYTRLTYERGDEAAADLAERLGRLVTEARWRVAVGR